MEKEFEKFYQAVRNKLLYTENKLNSKELKKLKDFIIKKQEQEEKNQEELLKIGIILDYNSLKENGKTPNEIQKYYKDDIKTINDAKLMLNTHLNNDHDYMFGYPANMVSDSSVISYLRYIESKLYFMNSCGNAYGSGNYRMSNNIAELEIIDLIKDNLDLLDDDYWGYISMGGTESNIWGIREGFSKYENGVLYYCDNSHYSVSKAVDMLKGVKCEKISSTNQKINTNELLSKIIKNYESQKNPAILVLSYGTTTYGSIDDIKTIKNKLIELGIPHYIHLDAALYGGIPKNQVGRPNCDIKDLDVDSIAISLHKYLGNTKTNGILLSKSKLNKTFIDYIGQQDITLLGSRDFYPFSTLQRIKEILYRNNEMDYINSVKYFEDLLNDNNIEYIKGDPNGNIFIIKKPSEKTCNKFQLATFENNGEEYSHIIIFPYHKKEIMRELVRTIKNDYYLQKKLKKGK